MDNLTLDNFITQIKMMQPRERNKIDKNILINLIVQLPDDAGSNHSDTLNKTMNDVMTKFAHIQQTILEHTQEIQKLKEDNIKLSRITSEISKDCTILTTENVALKEQLDGVETYLRINNIEIAGLSDPVNDTESVEAVVLDCLNGLNPDTAITPKDIDICHELPQRNGGKNHVVRFISRKTKLMIIDAKKRPINRQYQYRNNNIYINEHLTSKNKHLFMLAKEKKNTNNYKFLWTRGGKIFIRKDDTSAVIKVDSEDIISTL